MKLLEDIVLTDAIEIRTTRERIFEFFTDLVDDESYRAWHPDDHVTLCWIEGPTQQEGSVVYAEEYFHEKLHKLTFAITKMVPNSKIEYVPLSPFLRRYFSKNTFSIEPKTSSCLFTATIHLRLPLLLRLLAKKSVARGLSNVRKHMKKEGENLKKMLEAEKHSHIPRKVANCVFFR